MVISGQIGERMARTNPNIVKDFPKFRIVTLHDVLSDQALIEKTRILLTFKLFYRENEELFRHILKIVTCIRFHDDEGLSQIRSLLN